MNSIKVYIDKVTSYIEIILGAAIGVCLLVINYQVVMRYFFNDSPSWTEELARYINAAVTFFGTAIAVRVGSHVSLDFLPSLLSEGVRRKLNIINEIICLLFFIILFISSYSYMKEAGDQLAASLRIPMAIPYSAILLSAVLGFVYSLEQLINKIGAK